MAGVVCENPFVEYTGLFCGVHTSVLLVCSGNSSSEDMFQNTPSQPNRNRFGAARASLSKLPNPHPWAVCPRPPPVSHMADSPGLVGDDPSLQGHENGTYFFLTFIPRH